MATAVLGLQWGDEGKGKITHLLARDADMVVRFNGGANAGHTVIDRGVKFGTHLLPAGAFYPDTVSVLAGGMVIDLAVLGEEVDAVARHIGGRPRVLIAENAHLVLPFHRHLEEVEGSGAHFGTTRRGIAPAYRDKVAHVGIRAGDLRDPDLLRQRLAWRIDLLRRQWPGDEEFGTMDADAVTRGLLESGAPFMDGLCDVAAIVGGALDRGDRVLFEGAQGALLDVDHGSYPFVTSSSTTFPGLAVSIGLPCPDVTERVGVAKAYTTRVGEGPFPTELPEQEAARFRERGGEYGVTTGRPRRCGWIDLVGLRHAVSVNGITSIALTKVDVLGGETEIKVCRAYRLDGELTLRFPQSGRLLSKCEPVYETLPGWSEPIGAPASNGELPRACRELIRYLEQELDVPVEILSYGPRPEETLRSSL